MRETSLNCRLKQVCHVCAGGKEADGRIFIGRVVSVLAELRSYWPSCSVTAEFVIQLIRTLVPYKFCITNS